MNKFMVYGKDTNGVTHKKEIRASTSNWALFKFLHEHDTDLDPIQFEVLIAEKIQ